MSGKPQNVLFILADQFRHSALGVTSGGAVKTPHLDRLVRQGTQYVNAYTPLPVCAPARQALLTGRHPDAYGAFWNYNFFHTPPLSPCGSWPEQLAARGSRGAFLGKWNASPDHGPQAFGFEEFVSFKAHNEMLKEKYPDAKHTGGWMGCESPIPLEDSATHFLTGEALRFIREGDADAPWHVWLDFGMPHLPCHPSAPFACMYDPADLPPWPGYDDPFLHKPFIHQQQAWNWRLEAMPWAEMAEQVARYYGMVSQLDDAIGRMLEALEAEGRLQDTLIIFTADHGDMCGNHRMFDKHYVMYDDIVRVPLALVGPGIPAQRSEALVSNCIDLPLTISDIMGLTPPEAPHGLPLPMDGGPGTREWITSSSNGQQFGMFNTRMITNGHMKYVWNLTDVDELYNLDADPGEIDNRIDDPAYHGLLADLRHRLHDDLVAHGDPFMRGGWVTPQLLEGRKCR